MLLLFLFFAAAIAVLIHLKLKRTWVKFLTGAVGGFFGSMAWGLVVAFILERIGNPQLVDVKDVALAGFKYSLVTSIATIIFLFVASRVLNEKWHTETQNQGAKLWKNIAEFAVAIVFIYFLIGKLIGVIAPKIYQPNNQPSNQAIYDGKPTLKALYEDCSIFHVPAHIRKADDWIKLKRCESIVVSAVRDLDWPSEVSIDIKLPDGTMTTMNLLCPKDASIYNEDKLVEFFLKYWDEKNSNIRSDNSRMAEAAVIEAFTWRFPKCANPISRRPT